MDSVQQSLDPRLQPAYKLKPVGTDPLEGPYYSLVAYAGRVYGKLAYDPAAAFDKSDHAELISPYLKGHAYHMSPVHAMGNSNGSIGNINLNALSSHVHASANSSISANGNGVGAPANVNLNGSDSLYASLGSIYLHLPVQQHQQTPQSLYGSAVAAPDLANMGIGVYASAHSLRPLARTVPSDSSLFVASGNGMDAYARAAAEPSAKYSHNNSNIYNSLQSVPPHAGGDAQLSLYSQARPQNLAIGGSSYLASYPIPSQDPKDSHLNMSNVHLMQRRPPHENQLYISHSSYASGDGMSADMMHTLADGMGSLMTLAASAKSLKPTFKGHVAVSTPQKDYGFVMENDTALHSTDSPELRPRDRAGETPRKRARTQLSDDMEHHLKPLLLIAARFSFDDLAARLRLLDSNDPVFGPLNNSKDIRMERHHQLFALAWLTKQCEVSYTTVITRTRVYARYVDTCANQKLAPLMPTNFGKLVRVIFPNLTIRRLGMRGKSKYYYAGLKLKGDPEKSSTPLSPSSANGVDSPQSVNANTPGELESIDTSAQALASIEFNQFNQHFKTIELKYIPNLFSMIDNSVNSGNMAQPLDLPSIYSYFPDDYEVDYSLAENLQTLYRAHLTSTFELIRYMQADKLFEMCSTLLVDVGDASNLLSDEVLSDWVKDCDTVMYRAAVKMLARLHLQNVPASIFDPLKKLARELRSRLVETMSKHFPQHFVELKVDLASLFLEILSRLLRCIESGIHISNILSNPNEKVVMLNDWLSLDIPDIIMRELPCGSTNTELLIEILDTRFVKLMEEHLTTKGPIMAKYSEFLFDLPEKFPKVSPWLFSLLASNVLTTCIREMTLAGSRSFKSWWIFRCWVDEFIKWSMELGGYLYDDYKPKLEPVVKSEAFDGPLGLNHSYSQDLATNDSNYVDLLELIDNGGFNWI